MIQFVKLCRMDSPARGFRSCHPAQLGERIPFLVFYSPGEAISVTAQLVWTRSG